MLRESNNPYQMCERCEKKPVDIYLHPCPYAEEIQNNPAPICNCCEDCEHECAMDI